MDKCINGLNGSDMSTEIIKELTKIEENDNRTSEQVVVWARRLETRKAQSATLESLNKKTETKYLQETECKGKMGCNHENRLEHP